MHTSRMDSPADAKRWFYVDARKEPVGPVSFAELKRLHRTGRITFSTYVIEEGGQEWRILAQLPSEDVAAIKEAAFKWTNRAPVLVLLFVMPPLGLYLLWKSNRFSQRVRWGLTALGAVTTLSLLPRPSFETASNPPPRREAVAIPASQKKPQPSAATPEQLAAAKETAISLLGDVEETLSRIEQTNQLLLSDGYTGTEFRVVAQRLRLQTKEVTERVLAFVEIPAYRKSPFEAGGGIVGNPLRSSAAFLQTASLELAWMLDSNNRIEPSKHEAFQKSIATVRGHIAKTKEGLDAFSNPDAHEAAEKEKDAILAKASARRKQRISEFPTPRSNTTAQPFTIVNVTRRVTADQKRIDEVTIAAPTASCMEEYIQTTMKVARDHAAIRAVDRVDCILLPSAHSDPLFTLAITRYEPAKTGRQAWEIQATKAVYTPPEIAIMEAWKAGRAETPSKQTEEIEAYIVKSGIASYEDIWALPAPLLDEVAPIFNSASGQ